MLESGLSDPSFWETLSPDLYLCSITFIVYIYTGYVSIVGSAFASDLSLMEYQDSQWSIQAVYASGMGEVASFGVFFCWLWGFSSSLFLYRKQWFH